MSLIVAILLISIVHGEPDSKTTPLNQDLSEYIPQSGTIEGWEPVDAPQIYIAEDLYHMINGGAVIYYEYGFMQVITQTYENVDKEHVTLELYEMNSSAAAFGIYTFKTGKNGTTVSVGTDAFLEDNYLNFWKGKYLVTIHGTNSKKETADVLVTFAREVDQRIKKKGLRPPVVNVLLTDNHETPGITYVKGILALSNVYQFNTDNIFGVKEGAIGDYEDYRIFVFKYGDEEESAKWLRNAMDHFKVNSDYDHYSENQTEFSMKDKQQNTVQGKVHQKCIFVYVGVEGKDAKSLFGKIVSNMQ